MQPPIANDPAKDDQPGSRADLEIEIVEDHLCRFHYLEDLTCDLRVESVPPDLFDVECARTDAGSVAGIVDLYYIIDVDHREGAGEEVLIAHFAREQADILSPEGIGKEEAERSDPRGWVAHQAVGVSPLVGYRHRAECDLDLRLSRMEASDPVAVTVPGDDPGEEIACHQVPAHLAVAAPVYSRDRPVGYRLGKPGDAVVEEGIAEEVNVLEALLAEFGDDDLEAVVAETVVVRIRDPVAVPQDRDYLVEGGHLAHAAAHLRAAGPSRVGVAVIGIERLFEGFLLNTVHYGRDSAPQ